MFLVSCGNTEIDEEKYYVSLNTNCEIEIPGFEVSIGANISDLADPICEGHTFDAWYIQRRTSTDNTYELYDLFSPIEKEINLYAIFNVNSYTITYLDQNESTLLKEEVNFNGDMVDKIRYVKSDELLFEGWFLDTDLTMPVNFESMPPEDVSFYGKYSSWDNIEVWDGSLVEPTNLTQVNGVYYYEISSANELAYISKMGGDWLDFNYILKNNIKINDFEWSIDNLGNAISVPEYIKEWTPINQFSGIFDGNGYSISGVFIESDENMIGFFGTVSGGSIYNLNIVNSYIKGQSWVGGVIANSNDKSQLNHLVFDGTVVGKGAVGGVIGELGTTESSDLVNYGNIFGTDENVGGVMGNYRSWGTGKLINYGNVSSSSDNVGGVIGSGWLYNIEEAKNYGYVKGRNSVGGVIGWSDENQYCRFCENYSTVEGVDFVGGIAGQGSEITIASGVNQGDVYGVNKVGGIIGFISEGNVVESTSTGTIYGETLVGGIAGDSGYIWGDGIIENCFYLKDTTSGVNINIYHVGNLDSDSEGIAEGKESSFFD
jgi:hypothetical protein